MAKVFCVVLLACVATTLGQYQSNYNQIPYYRQGSGYVSGAQQNNNNGGQQGGSSRQQGTGGQQSVTFYGQQFGGQPAGSYGSPYGGQQNSNFGGQSNDLSGTPAYYDFGYQVSDPYGSHVEFGHQEQRRGYDTQGNYQVVLPDGSLQHVVYTADQDGYRPVVSYYGTGIAPGNIQGNNRNGFGGNNNGGNNANSYSNTGSGRSGHYGY